MPNLQKPSLLTQAQQFAQASAWSQVAVSLQRLVNGEGNVAATNLAQLAPIERRQWLNLALQALEWGDFQLRWEIGKLLPKFERDAMEALLELLSDDELHPDVRWFAVRALADFPHPEVIPTLLRVVQSSLQPELQQVAANALSQMGPSIVPLLTVLVDRPETRASAAQILTQMRHREAIPLLLELTQDPDAAIRATAIDALSGFHSPQIAQVLLMALADYASEVRLTAVRSVGFCLADLPDTDWLVYIQPLLHDVDLDVSRQAALTLARLATVGATKALAEVLRSPLTPEPLAIDTIRALCWMERHEAVGELHQIWATTTLSQPLRKAICQNLGRVESPLIREQVVGILLEWLAEDACVAQAMVLRQTIITALGLLGDSRAVEQLIQGLAAAESRLQLHLVAALKQIDPVQAHDRLAEIAKSATADLALQKVAVSVLQEW
ncbi:HEAT repeat domain-containing protein [filamentous cyanobacterium LEGE 11480]|uniref:HEAT repeat domain-containing protein n=1 Tax=Romeriopsis navalis LEGE 11480 TaxID=2777977 RepID=A0A928VTN6_9CYAN|nr:HEAT repeat domain-containing protein [Romeriopsis navalis]MBE9032039.1 HEAT repeat domain-containing protein [Romeriopsis navalis LEGE 11480]